MKSTLYNILSTVLIGITFTGGHLLINQSVSAQEIPQVPNSYTTYREPNFFSQGRKKFDKEIQLLIWRDVKLTDNVLKINHQIIPIQEQLLPLEKCPDLATNPNICKPISKQF